MTVLRVLAGSVGVAAVLAAVATPAYAAPAPGAGCTFERGLTTCVTTMKTVTGRVGPFNASSVIEDQTLSGQWCLDHDGPGMPFYLAQDVYFDAVTTRTTTTTYRGWSRGHGTQVTKRSTTSTAYVYVDGFLTCGLFPF